MNKFLAYLFLISLMLSLCSCVKNQEPIPQEPAQEELLPEESEQQESSSMPELETIVEPVSGEEQSGAPESEAGISGAPGDVPAVASEPVISATQSAASSNAEISASGLLGAVAPSRRLDSEVIEKELLRLINSLRDEVNENSLGIADSIQFAARIRAAEALESFSHTRPDGMPYNTAFDEAGFSYAGKWHGENLSSLCFSEGMFNEKEIALEMFKGLKNSPGHYRNMTEKNFIQAGVGVAIIYGEGIVDVASAQMFSSL